MDLSHKLRLLKEMEQADRQSAVQGRKTSGTAPQPELLEFDFPLELEIGRYPLRAFTEIDCSKLASLCGIAPITACGFRDLLFWDTETTGTGGSGALVFLVGTLCFTEEGALIRQYLLPEPAAEPEFLQRVRPALEACAALVSYNGRTFDTHALRTRCIINRQSEPEQRPQLDLIHPSRNAFKQTLADCTLKRIEREILAVRRPPDDIASALIPAQYAAWLATRDRNLLEPILEHNRYDLLSLTLLALYLTETVFRHPERLPARGMALLALKIETSGNRDQGNRLLEKAFNNSTTIKDKLQIGLLLKKRLFRSRATKELRQLLKRLYQETGMEVRAAVEWAKQLEHRDRNYPEAIRVVREAAGNTDNPELRNALTHRLERLLRKAGSN